MVTALRALGLEPGDKVALLSKNCAQWFIADLAMQMGIRERAHLPHRQRRHHRIRAAPQRNQGDLRRQAGRLEEPGGGVPGDLLRIALPYDTMPATHQWDDLLAQYDPIPDSPVQAPDALLSLVYTSGSTGKPKGAMLSVERYAWSWRSWWRRSPHRRGSRLLHRPLPTSPSGSTSTAAACSWRCHHRLPRSLDTFIEDVKRCRPTVFISVPRLWAMFRIKIHEKLPQKKLALLLKIPRLQPLIKSKLQRAGAGSGAGAGLRLCAGGPGAAGVVPQHRHPSPRPGA